ncbi:tyrosine-type recombinase/integrase [Candidatus Microgenomates bacterium]|nr:tyrosine-type recombinase/integrase [Candidatus Microgenomates bacterium]
MANSTLLADLVLDFIAYLRETKKSDSTIIAYKKDLEQLTEFLARLGKTEANSVLAIDLESFLTELAEKKYTPKSVARKLNAIKGFFRWLRQKSLIGSDPAFSVAHPKYQMPAPRVLSVLEYRALRDAARSDPRTAAIVEILLQTGMRISELAALTLDDITPRGIKVGDRTLPLHSNLKTTIDNYLKTRGSQNSKHLFITKTGRPLLIRNIRSTIERCFVEAGVEDATVNDIRNTFIVHQLTRGVDLVTLSKIVGHKRLSTTERYLSLIKEPAKGKTNQLEEL